MSYPPATFTGDGFLASIMGPDAVRGLAQILLPTYHVQCLHLRTQCPTLPSPARGFPALPSEFTQLVLRNVIDTSATGGTASFAAWPSATVCTRLRNEIIALMRFADCANAASSPPPQVLNGNSDIEELDLSGWDAPNNARVTGCRLVIIVSLTPNNGKIYLQLTDYATYPRRSYRHQRDDARKLRTLMQALASVQANVRSLTQSSAAVLTDRGLLILSFKSLMRLEAVALSAGKRKARFDETGRLSLIPREGCRKDGNDFGYTDEQRRDTPWSEAAALATSCAETCSEVDEFEYAMSFYRDVHFVLWRSGFYVNSVLAGFSFHLLRALVLKMCSTFCSE